MSLLFRRDLGDTPNNIVPTRTQMAGGVTVSADSAMRASAVWASLRLRADLVSTTPLEVYRNIGGIQVDSAPTPLLVDPSNDGTGMEAWLYASQMDLDRVGNTFGIITAFDAAGYPAVIELQPASAVSVVGKGSRVLYYRIGGKLYTPDQIWHERQFVVSGMPMGLSPITYAAWSIGNYLSAQQFGLEWFAGAGIPTGRLKNVGKTISPDEARIAKERFRAAIQGRDLFVHGSDWEYDTLSVAANESQFIETLNYGVNDIARFFGVPSDLIDAPVMSSAKITYANITQRHLQLLVLHLGPVFIRRERKLSTALPRPRFVKFDIDSLLRMDPQTLQTVTASKIQNRQLLPSEARADDNRAAYTEADYEEFDRLFGKASSPAPVEFGKNDVTVSPSEGP